MEAISTTTVHQSSPSITEEERDIATCLETLRDFLLRSTDYRPTIGVICGSGLSGLSNCLEDPHAIPYSKIPGFPDTTVVGHSGEVVFGKLDGSSVMCFRGRFHTYEGHDVQTTAIPVRVMALLGVKTLIVTNAAGGLNPAFNVGDVVIINDHFNLPGLAGKHPLVGPNDNRFGSRFTPLNNCYNARLQRIAYRAANTVGIQSKVRQSGVYCFVSGPTYETPSEAKFLRLMGGDSVGMSTVPEVVVAAHSGIQVLGLSLITNKVILPGETGIAASHQEVLDAVNATQKDIESFVRQVISDISTTPEDDPVVLRVQNSESSVAKIEGMVNSKMIQFALCGLAIGAILLWTGRK